MAVWQSCLGLEMTSESLEEVFDYALGRTIRHTLLSARSVALAKCFALNPFVARRLCLTYKAPAFFRA